MKWANAKNSIIADGCNRAVDARYADIINSHYAASKRENVEQYLARGGSITRIGGRKAMERSPTITTMRAVDAAKLASEQPSVTTSEIMAAIPAYAAALPRRSWIAKFLATVNHPERFRDLV